MWWWTYEWPQLITIQPFLQKAANKNLCEIKFQANPRLLLDVISHILTGGDPRVLGVLLYHFTIIYEASDVVVDL